MTDPRAPYVFEFKDKQAQLMRSTVGKNIGQAIRGPTNIAAAKELEEVGMVSLEPLEKGGPGLIMKATPKGREAWHNFGLKAAGRLPICLT